MDQNLVFPRPGPQFRRGSLPLAATFVPIQSSRTFTPSLHARRKYPKSVNSRLTIERHADLTGLRVRYQKVRPSSLPEGLRPRSTTAESKGLEGSNPVRSSSQADFCAALRRPAGNSRVHAAFWCTESAVPEIFNDDIGLNHATIELQEQFKGLHSSRRSFQHLNR